MDFLPLICYNWLQMRHYRCHLCGFRGTHDAMWRHSFHVHRHGERNLEPRDVDAPSFEGVSYHDDEPDADLHL